MSGASKFTPGPWGMPDAARGLISKGAAGAGWQGIIATADVGDYARSREEGLANARLISAAPDLLAALRSYDALVKSAFGWADDVKPCNPDAVCSDCRESGCISVKINRARAAIAKATGDAL